MILKSSTTGFYKLRGSAIFSIKVLPYKLGRSDGHDTYPKRIKDEYRTCRICCSYFKCWLVCCYPLYVIILKLYLQRNFHGPSFPPPPPRWVSRACFRPIVRILDVVRYNKGRQFCQLFVTITDEKQRRLQYEEYGGWVSRFFTPCILYTITHTQIRFHPNISPLHLSFISWQTHSALYWKILWPAQDTHASLWGGGGGCTQFASSIGLTHCNENPIYVY